MSELECIIENASIVEDNLDRLVVACMDRESYAVLSKYNEMKSQLRLIKIQARNEIIPVIIYIGKASFTPSHKIIISMNIILKNARYLSKFSIKFSCFKVMFYLEIIALSLYRLLQISPNIMTESSK